MNYIFHPPQENFDDVVRAKGPAGLWQGPPGSRHLFCVRTLQQDVTSYSSIHSVAVQISWQRFTRTQTTYEDSMKINTLLIVDEF